MADLSKLPPPPAGYTVHDAESMPPPPAGYTISTGAAPDPVEAASDPKTWGHSGMTWGQMATHILASPATSLLHAPQQIIDFFKTGGHNPSGGFLSEEPITMAYGNAIAAAGALGEKPAGAPPAPPSPPSVFGTVVKGAANGAVKALPKAIEESALKYTGVPQIARGAIDGAKAALKDRTAAAAEATRVQAEAEAAAQRAAAARNGPLRPPLNPPPPQTAGVPPATGPRAPLRPPLATETRAQYEAATQQAQPVAPAPIVEVPPTVEAKPADAGAQPISEAPPVPAEPKPAVDPEVYAAAARSARADKASSLGGAIHEAGIPYSDLSAMTLEQWRAVAQRQGVSFPTTQTARMRLINESMAEVKKLEAAKAAEVAPGPQLVVPRKTAPGGGMGGMKNYWVEPALK